MRVAITGATGNVGTSLIERLTKDDAISEIVGIARREPRWAPPKTTWVRCDVAVDDLTDTLRGVDALVHLAWVFQPTHRPVVTWRNNVLGSIRVFEAAAAAGVRTLVHASSVGAYSPGPDQTPVDESWPTHALPHVAYGREKAYLERVLDAYEREHAGIRVVRLRPAFIFKRSSAAQQRRLFAGPLLPGRLVRPALIPVVPDLPGFRLQALHSADAAQAYQRALERDVHGPFNIAAEPVLDAAAFAAMFGARVVRMPKAAARAAVAAAWHLHLVPASPHLLDLALAVPVMDTGRAARELGWQPAHSATAAVGEMIDGLQEGAGGQTPPLAPDAGGAAREQEIATGIGQHGGVTPDGR